MCCMTQSEFLNHPLISRLLALELDASDYAIYGSGQLLVHGLRSINDLDIVARGRAWARAREIGVAAIAPLNNAPMVQFWDGMIEVTSGWITHEGSVDRLIDEAEMIHGIRFVRLTNVLSYKKKLARPKDIADIEALQAHLKKSCCNA
jgi:hypothetical protein